MVRFEGLDGIRAVESAALSGCLAGSSPVAHPKTNKPIMPRAVVASPGNLIPPKTEIDISGGGK